jgi:hypothetical protein
MVFTFRYLLIRQDAIELPSVGLFCMNSVYKQGLYKQIGLFHENKYYCTNIDVVMEIPAAGML